MIPFSTGTQVVSAQVPGMWTEGYRFTYSMSVGSKLFIEACKIYFLPKKSTGHKNIWQVFVVPSQ